MGNTVRRCLLVESPGGLRHIVTEMVARTFLHDLWLER